jgi:hypothetical protein
MRCVTAGAATDQPTRRPVAARDFEHHGVGADLGHQSRRRDRLLAREVERPVDLVEHEEHRPVAVLVAASVLLDDGAADVGQHVGVDGGAGRIERRVESEQANLGQDRAHLGGGGVEARRTRHLERDAVRPGEVAIVIVVPRWYGIGDRLAVIDQRPIGRVDQRPRATRHEHRLDGILEAEFALVEARHRLPQLEHAVRRRVIGVPRGQGVLDSGDQALRRRKLAGVVVAHGQVAHRLPLGLERPHLGRDAQDLGADEPPRELGEAPVVDSVQRDLGPGHLGHPRFSSSADVPSPERATEA